MGRGSFGNRRGESETTFRHWQDLVSYPIVALNVKVAGEPWGGTANQVFWQILSEFIHERFAMDL
jgi:hypothetical protein